MSWAQGRRRSICKKVTYTPAEWERASELYRLAGGQLGCRSFGAFARAMTMTGEVRTVTVATDPASIRGEIRRVGQNIDQVRRVVNRTKTVTPEQMGTVAGELRRLNDAFDRLLSDWDEKTGDV